MRDDKEAANMEGQEDNQNAHLLLANKLFLLTHADVDDIDKVRIRDEVFASVKADGEQTDSSSLLPPHSLVRFLIVMRFLIDMASLYESLAARSVLERDAGVLETMRKKIDEEIKKLDEKCVLLCVQILMP